MLLLEWMHGRAAGVGDESARARGEFTARVRVGVGARRGKRDARGRDGSHGQGKVRTLIFGFVDWIEESLETEQDKTSLGLICSS